MEQRLRASPEQFTVLVDFMERHGDLSRPQVGPQGRLRADALWFDLSTLLNSIGGGVHKSPYKWKKVWTDWKTKTKKKSLKIRQHARGTGGGPSSVHSLTALEQRVLAVIGASAVVGLVGIQEQGFNVISTSLHQSELATDATHSQNIAVLSQSDPQLDREILASPSILTASSLAPSTQPTPPSPVRETTTPPPLSSLPQPPPQPQTPRTRSNIRPQNTTPRRSLLGARRNRGQTPFDRAVSEFVGVEQRRLEHEEARDRRLHERDMETLRIESQRIDVCREHNLLLRELSLLGQHLIDILTQRPQ